MSDKLIVCDAGPLIALAKINQIELLSVFFQEIILPKSVADECIIRPDLPGAQQIHKFIKSHFFKIYPNPVLKEDILKLLDSGESTAIQLAINLKSVLLIDEKIGRSVAKKLRVPIIGTAGLLLSGYKKGIIEDLELTLNSLKEAGYRLSDSLIQEVVKHRNGKR